MEELPRHWAGCLPYRALVYVRSNGPTPLFQVAGAAGGPWGAEAALRKALKFHPACCFYCHKDKKQVALTVDHVEPRSKRGSRELANLVVACRDCNLTKANEPIEVFNPDAGREWLSGVLRQVQERLNRLD
jgi:5-methylcytosine-specific restriction endonuclease McrA